MLDGVYVLMHYSHLMLQYSVEMLQLQHICPIILYQQDFRYLKVQHPQHNWGYKLIFLLNHQHLYLRLDIHIIYHLLIINKLGVLFNMLLIQSKEKLPVLVLVHWIQLLYIILAGRCFSHMITISLQLIVLSLG